MMSCETYPTYKDSGWEWLGDIPDEWKLDRTRNHFSFRKGLTITKENLQVEGVPTINYGEIHSKFSFRVDPARHQLKCVSPDYRKSDPQALLKKHDFIFADTSEDLDGSGNFSRYDSSEEAFAGYHTVIARLNTGHSAEFLAYLFDSTAFRNQVRRNMKGVKVYSITQGMLKTLGLVLAPLDEQVAIANFLDDKTAKIDKAIAQKEQLIALLKERKQIIIQNAVTKGLDPKAKMKDSGIEWIGEIPEHWEVFRSQYLFPQRKELAGKDDRQLSATQNYGVILQEKYEELVGRKVVKIVQHLEKRKHVELDDFVISMRSFQGGLERAWNTGCIRSSYVVLRPCLTVRAPYFQYLLKTRRYIEALQSTGNFIRDGQDLNYENFRKVALPLPPPAEQEAIGDSILSQSKLLERASDNARKSIQKLRKYKATLIDSAVTGKIKVPDSYFPS